MAESEWCMTTQNASIERLGYLINDLVKYMRIY